MKEKILNTLRELGFVIEERTSEAFEFEYEGRNYLYLYNDDDQDFINICMPAVAEFEDSEDLHLYKVADKMNATLKYVKTYRYGDSLWLYYEREAFSEEEDLKEILTRMIYRLEGAYNFIGKALKDTDDNDDTDEIIDMPADDDDVFINDTDDDGNE